jgi:hypothetical protein
MSTWSYTKVSLASSAGTTKGNITLSFAGATLQGPYTLIVTITYGTQTLSSGGFSSLPEGIYQARVVYFPRTENANTPYVVNLTLFLNNQQVGAATASILPT